MVDVHGTYTLTHLYAPTHALRRAHWKRGEKKGRRAHHICAMCWLGILRTAQEQEGNFRAMGAWIAILVISEFMHLW